MDNEKHETIADIVTEMRKRAEEVYAGQDGYPESWKDQMDYGEIYELADRIEAAYKRELEATCEKYSAVGNAAAIREALYAITRIDTRRLKRLLCELVEADIFDGGQISKTISAVEKARKSISDPPRNCDDLEVCSDYDESDEAIREEREAHEVDKADAKRKGEW